MLQFNTGLVVPSIKHNYLTPDDCWTNEELPELNRLLMYLEDDYSITAPDFHTYPNTLEGSQELYMDLYEWMTPPKYIQVCLVYHQLLYNTLVYLHI
jgi:hypothetical protein